MLYRYICTISIPWKCFETMKTNCCSHFLPLRSAGGSSCSTWCCRLPAGSKWATSCPVERTSKARIGMARIGMWNLICFLHSMCDMRVHAGCNLSWPDCRRCGVPQWRSLRLGSQGAAAGGGGIQKLATPGRMDVFVAKMSRFSYFWSRNGRINLVICERFSTTCNFEGARARRQYWLANSSYKVHNFFGPILSRVHTSKNAHTNAHILFYCIHPHLDEYTFRESKQIS